MKEPVDKVPSVDREEADKLIWLVEFLIQEWYVSA